jgi:thiol-disulfide isomerase/thioredoxin
MKLAAVAILMLLLGLVYRLQKVAPAQVVTSTLRDFQTPSDSYRKDSVSIQWQDAEGKNKSLKDYVGHVVIVSFWAHWCDPCLQELPTLNRLYVRLADPDLDIIGLNTDTDPAHIKSALEYWQNEALAFSNYFLPQQEARPKTLPVTKVFNKKGQCVDEIDEAINWDSASAETFIKKLLSESPAGSDSDADSPESE